MSGNSSGHRSHIGSKRVKSQGWYKPLNINLNREEVGTEFMSNNYIAVNDSLFTYTDSSTTGDYYPTTTWGGLWYTDPIPYSTPEVITTIIKEREVTKEVQKRTLYKVYVVDPRKSGRILSENTVIAENENQAMLKANVLKVSDDANLELEQLDVYVDCIGTFIRPRKETQRVKIAKTEEDD